jgi:hypothetical protein
MIDSLEKIPVKIYASPKEGSKNEADVIANIIK